MTAIGEHRSYREAVERLAAAQKSGAGVPAYLRWVNRGLGRRAAALAYVARSTPNQVTAASALFSLAGMLVLASAEPSPVTAVVATVLLLAGYALDSADGQLARLTGSGSVAGEWLDHVIDAVRLPLFHLAVAVYLLRDSGSLGLASIGVAFSLLSSAWFFAQTLAEKLSPETPETPETPGTTTDAPAWVSFAKLPYDVGVLYLIVLTSGWPTVFLGAYVALFAVTALVAALSMARKYRGLARAGVSVAAHQG
ncbi:CDP-alcohol phosphatidyltransferase family protein [Agromyces subbeticus]|uniref:CDP-alcohol phosphatidyltransferase family protein n=1 Tax=Agromyces subbeticus TaxID=293890 RepID=UPI0003B6C988|nr:CDP-alcohol phosphatidyltransferase family protein [Agromyces subbeticus]